MILLDTNVVSEIYRPVPSSTAIGWINAQPQDRLFLCTPVLAELRFGVERLAPGKRKENLGETLDGLQNQLFRERILVFDAAAAREYGHMAAKRQRLGRPIGHLDAMIAAIASIHGATLATRNTADFFGLDLHLINPFEASATS
jgi:predicted nucleic acid-binding protein